MDELGNLLIIYTAAKTQYSQNYWWKDMKRDVAEYVAKCLVC